MTFDETPLQAAIRAACVEHIRKLTLALKECRNDREEDQCRRAYADWWWDQVDVISQQHGMRPMLRVKSTGRITLEIREGDVRIVCRKPEPHDDWLKWRRVFAWLPVEVGPGDCRWLEFVERREWTQTVKATERWQCDMYESAPEFRAAAP